MIADVVAYRDPYGPYLSEVTEEDADQHADCEGRVGQNIVVL
jgi:hypothetical protein